MCWNVFARFRDIRCHDRAASCYWPKTSGAVLDGSHYYRSHLDLMMIEGSGKRLKCEAFCNMHDPDNYKDEITTLSDLQQSLSDMDPKKSKACLDDIQKKMTLNRLLDDFEKFSKECAQRSEMCLYWENYFKIIETVKNLVKSEREGDFLLYEKTVGEMCPIFTGGDGIQYIRCISFYHELLKNVKNKLPSLYNTFLVGHFVIKTAAGVFNAVSGDMKLEQTIQRSSKSCHGIIGDQRSLEFVTQWQLLYHEVLEISNSFRLRLDIGNCNGETSIHHDLRRNKIYEINDGCDKIKNFISERENPFLLKNLGKLKTISSQVLVKDDVAEKHLKFFELAESKFLSFKDNVYCKKQTYLNDTIKMFL